MVSTIVGLGFSSKLPFFQQVTKVVLPVTASPQMTIFIGAFSGTTTGTGIGTGIGSGIGPGIGSGLGSGTALPTDESTSKHTDAFSEHADAFCSTHVLLKLLTSVRKLNNPL